MSGIAEYVRPKPEQLRAMPMLRTLTPEEGVVLELKMETDRGRFWLCTAGAPQCGDGICGAYVVGRASVETLEPDENGERWFMDYGDDDVTRLQGIDYMRGLSDELDKLIDEQDADFTNERATRIDSIRKELHALLRQH
jgi:hypothetical protein